jgi:hypothetical protein
LFLSILQKDFMVKRKVEYLRELFHPNMAEDI